MLCNVYEMFTVKSKSEEHGAMKKRGHEKTRPWISYLIIRFSDREIFPWDATKCPSITSLSVFYNAQVSPGTH